MNIEKIIHKGKTVLKKVKDNGEISYSVKSVYLGLDIKTGKLIGKKMVQQGKKLLALLPCQI